MHTKIDSTLGKSMFGVVYNAGGAWEEFGRRGISHLMEHLMYKTYEDLWSKFTALDIRNNAMTSDNKVAFYCIGLDECIAQISQTILDRLTKQTKLWSKEQFENEKRVVLQEYNDYFNDQMSGVWLNSLRKYYNYYEPLGHKQDILDFTYENSLQVAKDIFTKPSGIYEVGNQTLEFDGEFDLSVLDREPIFGKYPYDRESVSKKDQVVVYLTHKSPISIDMASKITFTMYCLHFGLDSPMMQELREKHGLVYGVTAYNQVVGKKTIPAFGAQTEEKNRNKIIQVFTDFFKKDMQDTISQERFGICQMSYHYCKKDGEILPYVNGMRKMVEDYDEYKDIDTLSYNEVIDIANNYLNIDNYELIVY